MIVPARPEPRPRAGPAGLAARGKVTGAALLRAGRIERLASPRETASYARRASAGLAAK